MSITTGQLQPAPEVAGIFHLMSHLSPGSQSEPSIAACDQSQPSLGPATRSLGPPRGAQRVATGVSSQESHDRPAMARCDSDSLHAKRFYLFWLELSDMSVLGALLVCCVNITPGFKRPASLGARITSHHGQKARGGGRVINPEK